MSATQHAALEALSGHASRCSLLCPFCACPALQVYPKIESADSVKALDEILDASDGAMVGCQPVALRH